MLYFPSTKTSVEVVPPGRSLPSARLDELAALRGDTTVDGQPIERVALLFVELEDAQRCMTSLGARGLEVRALIDGGEAILLPGERADQRPEKAPLAILLPCLRSAGQGGPGPFRRRLVDGGPWVTFVWLTHDTVVDANPHRLAGRTLVDVEHEAVENLARRAITVDEQCPATLLVTDEFGAEALMLPAVLRGLAARLGGPLAIGVPKEGGFMVVRADDAEHLARLTAWTEDLFDGTTGRRISRVPLFFRAETGLSMQRSTVTRRWWHFGR